MDLRKKVEKFTGSGSWVGKGAQKVSDWAGGRGIQDYAGGTGSKRGAVESGLKVARTVGNVATFGLGAGLLKGATKAKKVAKSTGTYLDEKYRVQDAYDAAQRALKRKK
jgi:hypothetical protein